MIKAIVAFFTEKKFLYLTGIIVIMLIGYITYQHVVIDRIQKEKDLIQWNYQASIQEGNKKINDHRFDVIPQKTDIKDALQKDEKRWFRDNDISMRYIDTYAKVSTKIDTVFVPTGIVRIRDTVEVEPSKRSVRHTIDFSGKSHKNVVTFNSLNDSVYNARNQFSLEDSIRYVARKEKVRVGTKKFLFFRFPKYERFTKITVSNSNDVVKMEDVEIKISK